MTSSHATATTEQEKKARIILDRTCDAYVEIDLNNSIIDWNAQAEITFGWKRREVIGKTLTEVIIPARYREAHNAGLKHFQTQAPIENNTSNKQIEIFALRRDGQEFPAEMTVFPVPSGNTVNLGAFIRNLGEWQATDQKFRRLLDLAPDAMVIVNQQGNIVLVNSQTENIFGFSAEELVGNTVEKLIPDRTKFLAKSHMQSISTGLELYALRKDGTEFPVEISLSPLKTEEGLLISSAIRDITERKGLERDLQKQKELFQVILDSLADGVIVADHQGRFLVINRAAQAMTGIDYLEEVSVDKWSKKYGLYLPDAVTLYPPERLPLVRAMQGQRVFEAEIFVRNAHVPHGAWLSANGGPMEMGDGAGKTGVIVFRDISERKEAERKLLALAEELKRSNTELQQFASTASHDLQEPLRGVTGCLEIIEETYKGKLDDKLDELIRHAVDETMHMHALIDDLLLLSRVTTTGETLQSADLSVVLDRTLKNLQTSIKGSQAIITYDILPTLKVDGIQFIQLFQNLISNAIKFRSDKQPEIHIGAKRQDGHWLFSVRDNGIGFKQEYMDRIFLPFKRLHTRDKYPGTGIGLTICKRIVERHRGTIWAESEPNKGATFYFTVRDSTGDENHD